MLILFNVQVNYKYYTIQAQKYFESFCKNWWETQLIPIFITLIETCNNFVFDFLSIKKANVTFNNRKLSISRNIFFNFLQKNWFLSWDFFSFLFNWFLISLSPPVTRHHTVFWTKKLTVMTKIGTVVDRSFHDLRVKGSSPALHRRGRKLKMATTPTVNYYFSVHWNGVGGVRGRWAGVSGNWSGHEVWPKHHWLHTTWLPRLLVKF